MPTFVASRARPRTGRSWVAFILLSLVLAATTLGACGDDEPSATEQFCDLYFEYRTGVDERAEAGSDATGGDLPEIVDEAASVAPDELSDAWAVVVDSQNDFADARAEAGFDVENPDEEAFEALGLEAELAEAEDVVERWVDDHCEPPEEL